MRRLLTIYLIPGAVMQSVMIGGAYGTGREMTQYFTQYGMLGGLLGLLISAACIAIVFSLSIEVARRFRVFDYRSFAKVLLGPAWFLFEAVALSLMLLVTAVITAAAGALLADQYGAPRWVGSAVTFVAVVSLVVSGRGWVMRVLASWSLLLYAVFAAYLVAVFWLKDPTASGILGEVNAGWAISGVQYAMYNVAAIPIVLYACRAIETTRQAFAAGTVGALIGIVPAVMLHLSFAVDYPEIINAELPVYRILGLLDKPLLTTAYLLIIFGTFVETAAGNIQGIVERVNGALQERSRQSLTTLQGGAIAAAMMVAAIAISGFGLIALVARGYGALAWGFLLFYALPLITVGVYRLSRRSTELRN